MAAILIGLGNIPIAFFLNGVTFLVVAAVLWRLPTVSAARAGNGVRPGEPVPEEAAPSFREAVRPAMRSLSGLGIINLVDGFVSGGLAVLTVVIAFEVLGTGDAGTGWLNAAIGLGGLLGALLAGPITMGRRLEVPLAVGGVTLGVGIILVGQSSVLLAALAAMAVATAGMLLLEVVATTIFQREVPDSIRGRGIGAMDTLTVSAYALGAFLAPVLAAALDPVVVLLAFGVLMVGATVIGTLLVGRSSAAKPIRRRTGSSVCPCSPDSRPRLSNRRRATSSGGAFPRARSSSARATPLTASSSSWTAGSRSPRSRIPAGRRASCVRWARTTRSGRSACWGGRPGPPRWPPRRTGRALARRRAVPGARRLGPGPQLASARCPSRRADGV